MFNIFCRYNKNSVLEESKIKWDEIDVNLLKYIKVDKEIFETLPILSQQLIIQYAVIDKENCDNNINSNIVEEVKKDIILFNPNEDFNDFLNNVEIYAEQNFDKFISVLENLKKEKNTLYKRIKVLERNIKNNKNNLKNVEKYDKRNIFKYNNNIKKYEDELYTKIYDHRTKRILYEIALEIKRTIERKNNIKNKKNIKY